MKIYLENYGCQANLDDGRIMKGLLLKEMYEFTDNPDNSDIVIINTCIVKNSSASFMLHKIRESYNKDKKVIITGCMPEAETEKCKRLFPKASLIGTYHVSDITEAMKKILNNEAICFTGKRKEQKLGLPKFIDSDVCTIQIASGCVNFCTFCQSKLAKGKIKSHSEQSIVEEIRYYKNQSIKTFYLSSTDNGAYGLDIKTNLTNLLKKIIEINGNFKIRIGMANPWHIKKMLNELIEIYKDEKVIKFLHIPVQSCSDKVLKNMKRTHTVEDFVFIVKKFREEIPDISIATDIIVGYPTETEEDFQQTLSLTEKIKPEVLNISKFSSRPGTEASKLKQLNSQVIDFRSKRLTELYDAYKKREELIKIINKNKN